MKSYRKRPTRKIQKFNEIFLENLRERIKDLKEKSYEHTYLAAEWLIKTEQAFRLRIPVIVAIVLFSISMTFLSPLAPVSAASLLALELIKDIGSNFIWKIFENPIAFSAYYRSGKLEEDIDIKLQKKKFQKKVSKLLKLTKALPITFRELIDQGNEELLNSFLDELKKYDRIFDDNRASLIEVLEEKRWAVHLEFIWKRYDVELHKEPISEPTLTIQESPQVVTQLLGFRFDWKWWGIWIIFWVISMMLGALIIFWLFQSQTNANSSDAIPPTITALVFTAITTPYFTQTIKPLSSHTPSPFNSATSTNFPPSETTVYTQTITPSPTTLDISPSDTPTPIEDRLVLTNTIAIDSEGNSYLIPAYNTVKVMEVNFETCVAIVIWEKKIVSIHASSVFGNPKCQ